VPGQGTSTGTITFNVPAGAFRDVIAYDHFGDLGIAMFTLVALNGPIHPRWVYALFFLMTLHDYGHTASTRNCWKWLANSVHIQRWNIPRLENVRM
jgi:hypothetical protein